MYLPTVENIEAYLQHVEEVVVTTVSQATPNMQSVQQVVTRLQEDLARFWPSSLPQLPEIKIGNLGPFEVPPPPPPPPPPRGFFDKSADWVAAHPWKTAGIGIGVVGAGLLVGYGGIYCVGATQTRRLRTSNAAQDGERRQVVVVLGGDTPLGLPLVLDLEKNGYIVITSVSTPEAVDEIEHKSQGYVRAIVLDPSEPETIPYFFRSLSSTMNRRFPLNTTGDPHSNPSTQIYLYSIISLLTLPSSTQSPPPGPLESLGLQDSYPAYLQATHFTPLQVVQGLLPLLRTSPARARDAVANNTPKKSIIFCLPATDARVGLPFASAQAMSAAATLRGAEVLRREIRLAALTDETHAMKHIKVVTVDVGTVGATLSQTEKPLTPEHAMIDWTVSEKTAYGGALTSVLAGQARHGLRRKPTDTSQFVHTVVDVVSGGRTTPRHKLEAIDFVLGRIREWVHGDRVVVGAGARTYALASNLPAIILDALLNLPALLLSVRNALLPVPPRLPYPPPVPPAAAAPPAPPAAAAAPIHKGKPQEEAHTDSSDEVHSETGSDADVESGAEGSGVSESWISLQKDGEH
ncbi:hypothetical protein PsYK624_126260 [Phanerochaete sordida]|uniref:DUF1776-domain-containing protein n=1 Tax=Phanerochaete sordida TaxID=48140 RepID=A0A9P3LJ87_9APHY|nr:hypothetical protein PsYK624_126260 [Phanerochaete sordida]